MHLHALQPLGINKSVLTRVCNSNRECIEGILSDLHHNASSVQPQTT